MTSTPLQHSTRLHGDLGINHLARVRADGLLCHLKNMSPSRAGPRLHLLEVERVQHKRRDGDVHVRVLGQQQQCLDAVEAQRHVPGTIDNRGTWLRSSTWPWE